jgi:cell division protein FtsQ
MARKNGVLLPEEHSIPHQEDFLRPDLDDNRLLDLDGEQESPFLRGQKRVPARRGPLPRKTARRLSYVVLAIFLFGIAAGAAALIYRYGERSWRFRIQSSDDIEIAGSHYVTRRQIMEVMGGDIGRNLFFIPLDERKTQLEQIPWVESAAVMRFVPNRLRVEVRERTPIAFVRLGPRISLVDAGGHVMDLPPGSKQKFSFPVIVGVGESEPLSTRAARMKIYLALIQDLDSGGAHYSQELSEVDLADPDDVKVLTGDSAGAILIHLGSANYLDRYKIYMAHVGEWRQQFEKLESVDLRYERQIIVNPDLRGMPTPPAMSIGAVKAASAAGVKPAALIRHDIPEARPSPVAPPAKSTTAASAHAPARAHVTKPAPRKPVAHTSGRKPAVKAKHAIVKPAATKTAIGPKALSKASPKPVRKKPSPGITESQGKQ